MQIKEMRRRLFQRVCMEIGMDQIPGTKLHGRRRDDGAPACGRHQEAPSRHSRHAACPRAPDGRGDRVHGCCDDCLGRGGTALERPATAELSSGVSRADGRKAARMRGKDPCSLQLTTPFARAIFCRSGASKRVHCRPQAYRTRIRMIEMTHCRPVFSGSAGRGLLREARGLLRLLSLALEAGKGMRVCVGA